MRVRWPRRLTPIHLSQLIRSQKNSSKALEIFNEAKTRYPSYRHNGPVYATMIGILGSSGQVSEMKELINRMKNDSCQCQDSLFAGVIKTYAAAGLFDEAVTLFNSLREFNCVNFTESFNTLLGIMVRESKLETCYHFFVDNCHGWEIKSRTRSLNILMDALCEMKHSDLALHIFQEMGYQWCYPDRETYRTLMKGLCMDGRLTDATHLLYAMFWRISQKGCGADVSVYRILLDALCDNGQIEEAVEILEKVLRKGLRAPKTRRNQLDLSVFRHADKEGIQHAKALMNEALVRGGIPSPDGYSAMAIDLYSEGRILEGDNVLEEMYKNGFGPCLLIYEAKVAALFTAGKFNEAVAVVEKEMIEKNCFPTTKLHNMVIKGLCSKNQSASAARYFQKMDRQLGCVPDRVTYSNLVDGLCCDGKYVEASQFLEKMILNSHWPTDEIYAKLIPGLCITGSSYKAVMWLEEMINEGKIPQISTWCSLLSSVCCESQHAQFLWSTLEELKQKTVS